MQKKLISDYTVKFESDDEGGYIVTVPSLPEIVTGGRTLAESEQMVKEAISLTLRVRRKKGEPIPQDVAYKTAARPSFFTKVTLADH